MLGSYLSSLPPAPDPEVDIPATVSDVRLTIEPYQLKHLNTSAQGLRIYYGYLSDGKWYDTPVEYHDLIDLPSLAISTRTDEKFMWIETRNHAVKIGQFLLITIKTTGNPSLTTENMINEIISISDTISSEVNQHFEEYYDPVGDEIKYGIALDTAENDRFATTFGKWYSVLLEYDKLPTDYVLTVVCTDVDDNTVELTLTYDDIQELLATTESEQSAS